ncbi:hypothetical protein [Streptomyces sp. ML-6]|uniref:hypothetical protein n=1 Tax=Streptomyces sp. ML-6 TaxID=2982693 RepID=UPI0024C079FF|nr:hypothetical protein [Streptomyces sp. ML-6]MDK0522480.1 hypothetical protein [Streptomyces sp. ML-6]
MSGRRRPTRQRLPQQHQIRRPARGSPYRTRTRGCSRGETTTHDFIPGHELRAIPARVREHFGGSALNFITWLDTELPPQTPAA